MPKMVDDGSANDISSQPMQEACVIATSNNNMMSKRCLLASWLLKVALLARSQASCGAAAPVDQKKYWLSSSCELSSGRLMSHVSSAVEEGVHRQSSADRVLSDPSTIRFPDRSLQDFDTICASRWRCWKRARKGPWIVRASRLSTPPRATPPKRFVRTKPRTRSPPTPPLPPHSKTGPRFLRIPTTPSTASSSTRRRIFCLTFRG